MSLEFSDDEFLTANNMPMDAHIVVDANRQGIFCFSSQQQRFIEAFPATYKEYMKLISGDDPPNPGEVLFFTEAMYHIAILVTCDRLIGEEKDDEIDIAMFTQEAVKALVDTLDNGEKIVTCLVNSSSKMFNKFHQAISIHGRYNKFLIYRK